jgi:hypothetical protein
MRRLALALIMGVLLAWAWQPDAAAQTPTPTPTGTPTPTPAPTSTPVVIVVTPTPAYSVDTGLLPSGQYAYRIEYRVTAGQILIALAAVVFLFTLSQQRRKK